MPDLPEVTQRFDADVSGYLAGMEEMIAATDAFRASVDAALGAVEALHAAIDSLPDEKTIHVNVETSGMPEAAAAAAGAGGVPDTAGFREAEDAANGLDDAFARLDEILKEQGGDWEEVDLSAARAAETMGGAARDIEADADAIRAEYVDVATRVADAMGFSAEQIQADADVIRAGFVKTALGAESLDEVGRSWFSASGVRREKAALPSG